MIRKTVILSILGLIAQARTTAAQESGPEPDKVIHEAFPEDVPSDVLAAQSIRPEPLGLHRTELFPAGVNRLILPAVTADDMAQADANAAVMYENINPPPPRVGLVRGAAALGVFVDELSSLESTLDETRSAWTVAVRSPGAYGLRLHLGHVDLGESEMIIWGQDVMGTAVQGPFTGFGPHRTGEFWSSFVPGDEAFIEIQGIDPPQFDVLEVVHFDRHPGGPEWQQEVDLARRQAIAGGSNGSGVFSCHLDAMCESVNSAARRATGQMNYVSGGSSFVCTGTMLNDQDSDTLVPYFLTAYHCLNTQSQVNSLEVVWLYEKSSCNGTLPNYNTLPRSNGGTVVRTNNTDSGNDMTFIRLAGGVPGGVSLAGWTTATGITGHGIHHPSGSWRRATYLSGVGACPGCACEDPTDYDYYDMDSGLVEGGSSGSGIFNSSGQLAGQLLGRCSSCCDPGNMNCGNIDDYWAMYGEFEETHPLISYWLQVGGTFHISTSGNVLGNGTPGSPYRFISQAHSAAWNGLRFKISAGNYTENVTLTKQVTLIANGGTVRIGS